MLAYDLVLNGGNMTGNRNSESMGNIHVQYDCNMILNNVRNRHLCLNGRKSNIFALIGESMWVMAGREDTDYLMNFIPRANNFSDDGMTWRAAYGERMYRNDQLSNIMEIFRKDGKMSRRATLTIYHPGLDTFQSMKEVYNLDSTLDAPCNQWLNFWVDSDNKFNMKVIQRSGDVIWGAMSINLTEFSILHELMFNLVNDMYPGIELGSYNQSVTNLHVYEATAKQAYDALGSEQNHSSYSNHIPLIGGSSVMKNKLFFQDLCIMIETGNYNVDSICQLFSDHGVTTSDNILLYYVYFSAIYVNCKQRGHKGSNKKEVGHHPMIEDFLDKKDNEYARSIRESSFRNFTI